MEVGPKNVFPQQSKVILSWTVKHFCHSSASFKSTHTKSGIYFKFVTPLRIFSDELHIKCTKFQRHHRCSI